MNINNKIISIVCLLAACAGLSRAQAPEPGTQAARQAMGMPSVIYFYLSSSEKCHQLEDALNVHHGVESLAPAFRWYQVDVQDEAMRATAQAYDVVRTPAVVVLDAGGREAQRLGPQASAGDVFAALGKQLAAEQSRATVQKKHPLKFGTGVEVIDPARLEQLIEQMEKGEAVAQAAPVTAASSNAETAQQDMMSARSEAVGLVHVDDPADVPAAPALDCTGASLWLEGSDLVARMQFATAVNERIQIYFDTDLSGNTGYTTSNVAGADWLVEGVTLYRFAGANAQDWKWESVGTATSQVSAKAVELRIPARVMELAKGQVVQVGFASIDEKFSPVDFIPDAGAMRWPMP